MRCGRFVAETFAVTHPDSNDKLRKDIAKIQGFPAEYKFVFFLSPVNARRIPVPDVTIVRLEHPILGMLASRLKIPNTACIGLVEKGL